jgi:hypothetical protein
MLTLTFDEGSISEFGGKAESGLERLRNDAVIATGKIVVQHAKQGNFKDRTHQLRSTISAQNIGMVGQYFTVEVKAPKKYASFVEKGTRPHDIPKPARPPGKPLVFYWERMGVDVVTFGVHHPGSKAIPFFAPAFEYGRSYLDSFVRRGFADVNSRLGQ